MSWDWACDLALPASLRRASHEVRHSQQGTGIGTSTITATGSRTDHGEEAKALASYLA